ncbi:unnamed protein product, partial [Amoebophrya sp. A25]
AASVPYLLPLLGLSKNLPAAGLCGWAQSSIDGAVLNNEQLSAAECLDRMFGVVLDWSRFPVVTVKSVSASSVQPDGSSAPSRAAKNSVSVGDVMLMCGTLQERITLVSSWAGTSGDDALVQKIRRKFARKDNPVAGFGFLRRIRIQHYVQLAIPLPAGLQSFEHSDG